MKGQRKYDGRVEKGTRIISFQGDGNRKALNWNELMALK